MPRPITTATDTVADAHIATAPGRPTGRGRSIRLTGLLALVPLLTAPALAEPSFEGRFKGRGEGALDLQVLALGTDKPGEHLVIAETAIPNACTGEVRGVARRQGAGVLLLRKATDEPGQFCTVTLRYGGDGKRVAMSAEGCGDFHGTACDFVGNLTRRCPRVTAAPAPSAPPRPPPRVARPETCSAKPGRMACPATRISP